MRDDVSVYTPRPIHACLTLLLAFITAGASPQDSHYDEPYRPQVHFSPRQHWTNDPNGLVFFRGEYHLFFQFNPFGDQWGHMSWGHAVSPDLLHWKELPVAIPEKDGEMVFTGSVVVDGKNTSGLCAAHAECLVAIYTGHRSTPEQTRQTQNIAYSLDNGRTWNRYAKNPVIDLHMADFRDPSVFWDDSRAQWVMAVSLPKEHKVRFYSSTNLKEWVQLSDFGPAGDTDGDWECPDLLQVPAEKGDERIWALKIGLNPGAPQGGSGEQYFLGQFDGKQFTVSSAPGSHGWSNYGKDDYCAISFNGLPKSEKPVLLGWMSNWQYASKLPTSPWRGQMSVPRKLSFLRDKAGLALKQEPVISLLHTRRTPIQATKGREPWEKSEAAPFELQVEFAPLDKEFGVRLYADDQHWTEIGFDPARQEFYIDRTRSGMVISPDFPVKTTARLSPNRRFDVRLIVDRSSVEAYAQDGTIAMTALIFPPSTTSKVTFFPGGSKPVSVKGEIWGLRSIW